MACLLQGVAGVVWGFLPIYPTGLGGVRQDSGRVIDPGDCMAHFIPNMFYGVAIWRLCMMCHLGDDALLKEVED